jgi:gas vesicle protein
MENQANPGGKSGVGGFFLGFMTGVLIAGAAVLLYAPKSGPETRNLLKEEVDKTQQMFQCWANDVRQRADEVSQIIRFSAEKEMSASGNGQ